MNEIVFGIKTNENPGISDFLKRELEERAVDKRRKFKTEKDRMDYLTTIHYGKKKKEVCCTTAEFGMVVELGLLVNEALHIFPAADDAGEKKTIEEFWEEFAKHYDTLFQYGLNDPLIGNNIIELGMPFLLKRSVILGITPPRTIPLRKANNPFIYDISIHWEGHGHPGYGLATIAAALGIEAKGETLGDELVLMQEIYKRMKGIL